MVRHGQTSWPFAVTVRRHSEWLMKRHAVTVAWSLNGVSEQDASQNAHCHMASQCKDLVTIPGLGLCGPCPGCRMTSGAMAKSVIYRSKIAVHMLRTMQCPVLSCAACCNNVLPRQTHLQARRTCFLRNGPLRMIKSDRPLNKILAEWPMSVKIASNGQLSK